MEHHFSQLEYSILQHSSFLESKNLVMFCWPLEYAFGLVQSLSDQRFRKKLQTITKKEERKF